MMLNEMYLGGFRSERTNVVYQPNVNSTSRQHKSGASTFDMILGSKVNSTSNRRVSIKNDNSFVSTDRVSHERALVNGDRRISYQNRGLRTTAGSKESQMVSSRKDLDYDKSDKSSVKDDSSKKSLPNDLICAVSQILGISANKLQELLDEAGISSDMLMSEALTSGQLACLDGTSTAMAQLSKLLGLNNEQQQTLSQLIQMAGDVLSGAEGSSVKLLGHTGNGIGTNIITGMNKTGEVNVSEQVSGDLGQIIKEKLDTLSIRLESNELETTEELKRLIEPLTAKANGRVQQSSIDQQIDSIELTTDGVKDIADSARPETDTSSAGNGNRKNESSKSEKSEVESFIAPIDQKPQEAFDNIQIQPSYLEIQGKQNVVQRTETVQLSTPMQAKEILSQIIEKASVDMTNGKSEMSIELKPESLGRISLKVVTENGIVMAKFVAENEQVKEVLESNMHLLKDSLENQGMNVQGFSVSVRQDSNRQRMNWERQNNNGETVVHGASPRTSEIVGNLADPSISESMVDPYRWESSTINLTA